MAELKLKDIYTFRNLKHLVKCLKMKTLFRKLYGKPIEEFNTPIEEWLLTEKLLKEKYTDRFYSVIFEPNRSMSIRVYVFY